MIYTLGARNNETHFVFLQLDYLLCLSVFEQIKLVLL